MWGIVFLLSVALTAGGMYSLASLAERSDRTAHAQEVRVAIGRLLATLVDAETGSRGYFVAGDATFLEPYDHAMASWRGELATLSELTSENAEQHARLASLQQVVGNRLDTLGATKRAYEAGERGAAFTEKMQAGKQTMDDARRLLAEMDDAEQRLYADRTRSVGRHRLWTAGLLVAGIAALLATIATMWVQRRKAELQRQRVEDTARAQQLFRTVLEGVDLGITVQDATGALVYANAAGARITGFDSPAELLSAGAETVAGRFEMFGADGAKLSAHDLPSRAVLQGGTAPELLLQFQASGTRQRRWSITHSVPVRGPAGELTYVLNFFREVTKETREAEQRAFLLRAVDEWNASLDYEQTLDVVARLAVPKIADWCAIDLVDGDRTKRVALAHVDASKLQLVADVQARYPADPAASRGVPAIIRTGKPEIMTEVPAALVANAARDADHRRLIEQLEIRSYVGVPLRTRDKTIGALTLVMAESDRRFDDDDLQFAQALADRAALAIDNARMFRVVQRANDRIAAQLTAETARREHAEDATRFAEAFIGILGHDLRNPLNAVAMAAHVLRQKTSSDELKKIVQRIQTSTGRMTSMVEQLLDLTRSRLAGGIAVEVASCNLGAIICDVIEELRLVAGDRAVVWREHEVTGRWDRHRLAQVISNLVGNALEHGDKAEPVSVALTSTPTHARVVVGNRGSAIAPELLPVLFDPYRRVALRGPRSKGLGLGLFISEQIVTAHGGTIEVASTPADGTVFSVTLPRGLPHHAVEAPGEAPGETLARVHSVSP